MHLRLRYKVAGGHVHCRLFVGKRKELTHGKAGDLVFDVDEWPEVRGSFETIGDVEPEDEGALAR